MIRALILAAGLAALCTVAQARELTAQDLHRIEDINQARNRWAYGQRFTKADPVCGVLAINKANDLLNAGYAPEEVRIDIVADERGQPHAVAGLVGTLKGKPLEIVLDSRFDWTLTRKDAEAKGYVWRASFAGGKP